jgi:hypothetical protein
VAATLTPDKYSGIVGTLKTIVKEEGVLRLWRGNFANFVRVVPYSALQFTSYEFFKKELAVYNRYGGATYFHLPSVTPLTHTHSLALYLTHTTLTAVALLLISCRLKRLVLTTARTTTATTTTTTTATATTTTTTTITTAAARRRS